MLNFSSLEEKTVLQFVWKLVGWTVLFHKLLLKSRQTQWFRGPLWWQSMACSANLLYFVSFESYNGWQQEITPAGWTPGLWTPAPEHCLWIKSWFGEKVQLELLLMNIQVPIQTVKICEQGFFKPRYSPVMLALSCMHRGSGTGFLANVNQNSSSGSLCWLTWAGGPALGWGSSSCYEVCECV